MTTDPLIPSDVLPGLTGRAGQASELLSRIQQLDPPLDIDLTRPSGHALALAMMFERWPDLIPGHAPDPAQRLYNEYFWFRRFANLWQAEHGFDAGIEQQANDVLGRAEGEVDWNLILQLDERARKPA
jgi:hypothetical protein